MNKLSNHASSTIALDMFSTFDDHHNSNYSYLIWYIPFAYFPLRVNINAHNNTTINTILGGTQAAHIGGATPFLLLFMYIIFFQNYLGLAPYIFSTTSHIAINITFALPVYICAVLIAITNNTPAFLAHLTPTGAPAPLTPFLCVIELISNIVRPITLAVRLTANISTGHILIGLIASATIPIYITVFIGAAYFAFETAVCIIQAYIFTLLPTLYVDEAPFCEQI